MKNAATTTTNMIHPDLLAIQAAIQRMWVAEAITAAMWQCWVIREQQKRHDPKAKSYSIVANLIETHPSINPAITQV
jgi:hypothetical protein